MAQTSKTTTRSKTPRSERPPEVTASTPRKARTSPRKTSGISLQRRQEMVAEAAYLRAEQRGFTGGDALEDWLAAEREVDLLLGEHASSAKQ